MLKIYFAPIQGYTEDAYRRLHHRLFGGVDEYFTPFMRLEHGQVRSKDLRDIRAEFNSGVPVTPQVIANGAGELEALLPYIVKEGYTAADINMGCSFPLQTKHGRGCGLLPHPEKVAELMDVVRAHPELQFSVKMRLGLESETEWKAVLPVLNEAPLRHITLHARTGVQQDKGTVHREMFREFQQACRHPLIYNGDLTSLEDLRQVEQDFPGLEGVMLGRGLLARPCLGQEYKSGQSWAGEELLLRLRQLHDQLLEHYEQVIPGEAQRLQKIQTFWDYLEETLGRKTWKKLRKAGNMKNYRNELNF